jgi:hypothetical protein
VIILVLVIVVTMLLLRFVMLFLPVPRGRILGDDDARRRKQRGCEKNRANESIASLHKISLGWIGGAFEHSPE